MAAESASRKRRHSHKDAEGGDVKRIKVDTVLDDSHAVSSLDDIGESGMVKHKKHKHVMGMQPENRRHTIEPATLHTMLASEEGQNVSGSSHKKKKKKHRQSLSDDCVSDQTNSSHNNATDQCSQSWLQQKSTGLADQTSDIHSNSHNNDSELQDLHKHKKKHKKKHANEVSILEVQSAVPGFVDSKNCSVVDESPNDCESSMVLKHKKKKRRHHQEVDVEPDDSSSEIAHVQQELSDHSGTHKQLLHADHAQVQHLSGFPLTSAVKKRMKQPCMSTDELRYKADPDLMECQPDTFKDRLWWEDIANNQDLETWLVRAPVDFSATTLDGARGKLFDSVVVPRPGQLNEDYRVTIQGINQPQLVVLLPSKSTGKFHIASEISGYVTVTRSASNPAQGHASTNPVASSADTANVPVKKHKHKKEKEAQELPCDVRTKHKSRHSIA